MSTIITLKEHPAIQNAVRVAAPKYRKHKAIVVQADQYTNHGSYWDGGSYTSAWFVRASHSAPVPGPTAPPQFGGGDPVTVDVPEGGYIVVHGTFCGKTATATVYIRKSSTIMEEVLGGDAA